MTPFRITATFADADLSWFIAARHYQDASRLVKQRHSAPVPALFIVCDNLRKDAALNAIQIAELLLERRAIAA